MALRMQKTEARIENVCNWGWEKKLTAKFMRGKLLLSTVKASVQTELKKPQFTENWNYATDSLQLNISNSFHETAENFRV